MAYRIERIESTPGAIPAYTYRIYDDEQPVATYWHDHRGDEHGIDFVSGDIDEWPVGLVTDFIKGGGPQEPLTLSAKAIEYLNSKLGMDR